MKAGRDRLSVEFGDQVPSLARRSVSQEPPPLSRAQQALGTLPEP